MIRENLLIIYAHNYVVKKIFLKCVFALDRVVAVVGERTKRGALLHGVPYGLTKWSTLKILFRMRTVDQCVSGI